MTRARHPAVDATLLARKRWSEAEAQAILDDAETRGESISEYGRRWGIDPQRLHRWKRLRTGAERHPVASVPSGFLPVRVTPEVANVVSDEAKPALEVVLPGGRLIRVTAGFDATTLVRLLAALEDGT